MEEFFDSDIFVNREYEECSFKYKDCVQPYKASKSAMTDYDLTGQIVWRAAEQLAEFIVENKDIFKDKVVLELGAGVGLSGLVCAQYAKSVIITDGNEIICELMELNTAYAERKNVTSEIFPWGDLAFLETKHPSVKFDIIIGADIMFWPQSIEPLAITLKQFLDKFPDLVIFSATRIRAGVSEKLFDIHLTERGLHRQVLYKEGENVFYKISAKKKDPEDIKKEQEEVSKYVIPHKEAETVKE